MSRLAKDLFFILMLIILLRSDQELLIVLYNGDNVLAKSFLMLCGGGADGIPEMIGNIKF